MQHGRQRQGEVALDCQQGVFEGEDSVIGQVTGEAPMIVQSFVTLHRDLFNA